MDFPVNILNDGETFANLDGCWIADVSKRFSIEEFEEQLADDSDKIPTIGYWYVDGVERRAVFCVMRDYKDDVYLRIGANLVSVAEIEKML